MHWSLLIVASSMANEEDPWFLTRTPARTHLPTCPIFLAPSTIPGSEYVLYNAVVLFVYIFMMCGLLLVKFWILNCRVVGCIGDIGLQLYSSRCIFEQCAYLYAVVVLFLYRYLLLINLRHQICLDSKQLVSEFLQDVLSKKMR